MPIPILLPPQVNSPDHIWSVFMYLFLRYSQFLKSQPRHCLCQLLLLSPTPPLIFLFRCFVCPPSGTLCFLTQTNTQIGKLSFICYILGYSGCLEFMKMFPRVRGYVSILVAMKNQMSFLVTYPGIVTEKDCWSVEHPTSHSRKGVSER